MKRTLALLLLSALLVTGCSDDDGGGGSATNPTYMLLSRIRTPLDRTMYVSLLSDLEHGEVDLGNALEVPGVSRARVYDGKLYVFDGERGEVRRYLVNGRRVPVLDTLDDGTTEARFSMSNEGVSIFSSGIAFISPDRAYYFDTLSQDQVVVWNPTTMEVVSTFAVPEFVRGSLDVTTGRPLIIGDYVVIPVSYVNAFSGTYDPNASMAVFSTTSDGLVTLIDDPRCIGTSDVFEQDGSVYVVADKFGGAADLAPQPGGNPPACVLRWTPGETAFDAGYLFDIEMATGEPGISGALGGDGEFLTHVYTSDIDPTTLSIFELLDMNLWQRARIDLATEQVTIIDGIPAAGISSIGWRIDDLYVVPQFDDGMGITTLQRIEADDSVTPLLTVSGEIFAVQRLR